MRRKAEVTWNNLTQEATMTTSMSLLVSSVDWIQERVAWPHWSIRVRIWKESSF